MLESVKIARRQSEIRQSLASLVGKPEPTEDEVASMETSTRIPGKRNPLQGRVDVRGSRAPRSRCRARDAGRAGMVAIWSGGSRCGRRRSPWMKGAALRARPERWSRSFARPAGSRGAYTARGLLEQRADTVSSGTPDPIRTMPVIDRLFAETVAGRMGGEFVDVGTGAMEWPITTSNVAAGWASSEGGDVADGAAFATTDRPLRPDQTLGVRMTVTRKALKQSGAGLEAAIRRDMTAALRTEMDRAIFQGDGANGEPTGLLNIADFTSTGVDAAPTYVPFLEELTAFMSNNVLSDPASVRLAIRPETYAKLVSTSNAELNMVEYAMLWGIFTGRQVNGQVASLPSNITVTSHALPAPAGSPAAVPAILTARAAGVAPFYVGPGGRST